LADFADIYSDPLTEEETEKAVDEVASDIVRRGLVTPAILLLESHKPLAGFIGHASVVFAPFALPFVGFDRYAGISRLLSKPGNVEQLIRRIEDLSEQKVKN
jgi:hypothetical protein